MSDLIFDNGEFARAGKTLSRELALADLPRVASEVLGGGPVQFVLAGGVDRLERPYLDLGITAMLELKCQRCLKPMPFELDVAARFTLFRDEERLDEAEAEDEELEGLVFEHEFDPLNLVEDEILLSLPFSPVHEACEAEATPVADVVPQKPNPFAVLADLKGKLKRGE
ncbi:MAG: DUF177 domain-containing protein [Burkholderiales bacterium]|nr:DUF177 domain-containing protein [Burkholderiales bacterium]